MDLINSQIGYAISILLVVCTTMYYYNKKKISDKVLFQEPPPKEDCPICMLPMPHSLGVCGVTTIYMSCCGKMLCSGCALATREEIKEGNMKKLCPYCRIPIADEDTLQQYEKRMRLGDAEAYMQLGVHYRDGDKGLPQDINKTIELWQKAAELGSCKANYILTEMYSSGEIVEMDNLKCIHHMTLAAIGGHENARYDLGIVERHVFGNIGKSMKHFIIAAKAGYDKSLKEVGEGYKAGLITKDEYAATLRAYQVSVDEMKSEQRTKAVHNDDIQTKEMMFPIRQRQEDQ